MSPETANYAEIKGAVYDGVEGCHPATEDFPVTSFPMA